MSDPAPIRRSAVLRGRGHSAVRATHAKTFELTAEPEISERATCVVAVGTVFDDETLSALDMLRGRVLLTLSAADQEVHGEALINPGHQIRERVVIRRSGSADEDTWAIESTLTAKDLSPEFVAALVAVGSDAPTHDDAVLACEGIWPRRDALHDLGPGTSHHEVVLVAEEIGSRQGLVLVGTIPPTHLPPRLRAMWHHADRHLDFTDGRKPASKSSTAALESLAANGIVAVSGFESPTSAAFLGAAARLDVRFALTSGPQPAVEALLAAGLPPGPHAWLGSPQRLSTVPAMPTVLRMPEATSPQVFGDRPVAIADSGEDLGTAVRWVTAEEAVTHVGALTVVGLSEEPGDLVDLHAVALALAEAGIAPRTLSDALAPFGLTRKKLYQFLKDDH